MYTKEHSTEVVCHKIPLFWPALILSILGVASFAIDVPLEAWFLAGGKPGVISSFLRHYEPFAHGVGTFSILLLVAILDPKKVRAQVWLLLMTLLSGAVCWILKLSVYRLRPRVFTFDGSVWDTFLGFFASLDIGWSAQSFPSSHTANAVALAIGLTWLYPRGCYVFALFAIFGSLQRVACGAHFPSDAFFGAAIAWFVSVLVLRLADQFY